MIDPNQQREARYFFQDFSKLFGRVIYDLFRFILSFIQGGIEMLFPSKR